ncbi:MAG: toxin-activating lysine-acyltransferase [Alphaproteobacteria bacterium]|nr:toxin-activating lysine-acyltransferase [Alphaproteobacteria bacterium]
MPNKAPKPQFPKGQLAKMTPQKLHLLIGEITSLMLVSKVHRQYQVRDIADIILPAINLGQYRIYRNKKREPIALVTWAMLSAEVEKQYIGGKMVLSEKERTSGDSLYFTDFIAPYGHMKQVKQDIETNLFPNSAGKSLRFVEGKKEPKLLKFHGVNYRKPMN